MRLQERLAQLLREALDNAGMSQVDLAKTMGLSAKHVNQLVNGISGAIGMYDYAAHALGLRWAIELTSTTDNP